VNKHWRYRLEATFCLAAYHLFRAMPLATGSAIGGAVARVLGPIAKVHETAVDNLKRAMPELSEREQRRVLSDMWDNLGRVFCEYAQLNSNAMRAAIKQIDGVEHYHEALASKRPVILISGHLGNWELLPIAAAKVGQPLHLLYRAPNNDAVEAMLSDIRKPYTLGMHAKGFASARGLLKAVTAGEPIGVLVDQKTNNGLHARFFDRPAMSLDAIAHFVHKYDAIILPARCIREEGARFRIVIDPPMPLSPEQSDAEITQAINDQVEAWVRQNPAQWFWVHKRWKPRD